MLNLDVVYEIIDELCTFDSRDRQVSLRNLALVCRGINEAVRPVLFAEVRWPHPDKHDQETGLHFFPEGLWVYFKTFYLDWPDHWPDTSPPLWGTKQFGLYSPKHLDKLENALPKMSNIYTFQMTCPFFPPNSFIRALVGCPNIKDLRIIDTPFNIGITSSTLPSSFNLERVTLTPVGEAIRAGEGPFDKKYYDVTYWTREYRKRHWNESHGGFYARSLTAVFCLARPDALRYIQISGSYCTLYDFKERMWPNLETLVLTGPEPVTSASLAEVVGRMPKLTDLRVLFSKAAPPAAAVGSGDTFRFVYPWHDERQNLGWTQQYTTPNKVLGQLKHLAVSNACNMKDAFRYVKSLERLAFVALINHPRIPIAKSREDVNELLEDIEANGAGMLLKHIRIVMEEGMDFTLFEELGRICPLLEVVEVEVCGYREGEAGFEWTDYGDAFEKYQHLRNLRIAIPFEGCDEHHPDPEGFLRSDRQDCGSYIASRVPALRRIGFEYRTRMGSHRYEDRWLDFDIERLGDGTITLRELGPTWYPFPEVWEPVPLQQ